MGAYGNILQAAIARHEPSVDRKIESRTSGAEDLADFIPRITPRWVPPLHLQPLLNVLHRVRDGEAVRVLLSVPPRHSKPLHEDTLVTMGDWTQRRIADLQVGDCIISGAGRATIVTGVHDNGILPVIRIETEADRSVVAEATHRFLTLNGWVRAGDLRIADHLRCVGDVYCETITLIEDAGQAHCWCITVADDESFLVSGGIITHNTETLLHAIPWLLTPHPDWTIAYASYAAKIAHSKSTLARAYSAAAGIRLSKDTASKSEWRTTSGGGCIATGVGGGLTGFGARCFPFESVVTTDRGPMSIGDVFRSTDRPRVLGYDHESGRPAWCRVVAARESIANDFAEISTNDGRRVTSTSDHLFYVEGRGYREAQVLCERDQLVVTSGEALSAMPEVRDGGRVEASGLPGVLRRDAGERCRADVFVVQEVVHAPRVRCQEERTRRRNAPLLHQRVQERTQCCQKCEALRCMREADGKAEEPNLFGRVLAGDGATKDFGAVQNVRTAIQFDEREKTLLRYRVQSDRETLIEAAGPGGRVHVESALHETVSGHAHRCAGSGPARLRGVQKAGGDAQVLLQGQMGVSFDTCGVSYRREQDEQFSEKSCDTLRELPHAAPSVQRDSVAVVRRFRREGVRVYDLQVEGCSNFFVEGILAHNCLIVDDCHKDRASAESRIVRDQIYDWFTSTAFTRVEPGGSVIVCHTRWSPDDLIGRCIKNKEVDWEVINLPAITTDVFGEDHALWPSRWSVDALRKREKEVGPYDWASLYQGEPRPRGGSVFNGVNSYTEESLEKLLSHGFKIAIGLDFAYSARTSADYSVAVVALKSNANGKIYILDMVRMQCEITEFVNRVGRLAREWNTRVITGYISGVERGVESHFDSARPRIPFDGKIVQGDKFTRAQRTAALWNAGEILMPADISLGSGDDDAEEESEHRGNKPWLDKALDEILSFTGLKDPHDDIVDAMCSCIDSLSEGNMVVVSTGDRSNLDGFARKPVWESPNKSDLMVHHATPDGYVPFGSASGGGRSRGF